MENVNEQLWEMYLAEGPNNPTIKSYTKWLEARAIKSIGEPNDSINKVMSDDISK